MANEFKIKNGLLVSGSITGVTEGSGDNSTKMASTSWVRTFASTLSAISGSVNRTVSTYTATAGQTVFTVVDGYEVGNIDVYYNGSRLTSAEYTATNGTTFTLTSAAVLNDILEVIKYSPVSVDGDKGDITVLGNSWTIDNGVIGVGKLSATGTPSAVTYLRGDNTWATISTNPGTVTSVSVVSTNGFAGTVATNTSTPAITLSTTVTGLLKGNGTAISAAVAGTDYLTSSDLTGYLLSATAASTYQPLDADLTAIGALSGTSGFLKKTAANTWSLDTSTYLTSFTETDPVWTSEKVNYYTKTQADARYLQSFTETFLGTVTSVSVVSANGFAGTVATASSTPAITLTTTVTGILKGNGTGISAAVAGTDYLTSSDLSGYLTTSSASATYQPLDGDLTAIAALSGTSGLLRKTAANTYTLDTNTYLTSFTETDPIWTAEKVNYYTKTEADGRYLQSYTEIYQGTVTSVSVTTANGISGSVATASSTPAITLTLGAITPTSVNSVVLSGSATPTLAVTGTSSISGSNTGDNAVNSLYSGLVSNATHTGDATGSTALTVVGLRGVVLPALGASAGLLRYTGTGTNTWVFDTSVYLTANQSITLSGAVSGSGTTSITTTLANSIVGIANLTATGTPSASTYLRGDNTWATISAEGGGGYTVTSQTTTYSVTATSGTTIVKGDTTGGTFTITLPTAVGNTATIIIKKTAGTAALSIDGDGTETIDGGLTVTINKVYESVTLISDNANWQIV